jgi:hypothetical protein
MYKHPRNADRKGEDGNVWEWARINKEGENKKKRAQQYILATNGPLAQDLQQELATYPARKAQSHTPSRVVVLTHTGYPLAVSWREEGTALPPLLEGSTISQYGYQPPYMGVTWVSKLSLYHR